jgi:tetratricopeptide (TPR) repeat protein
MKTNPIMERVVRLSEQWRSVVSENREVKVFCWLGNSMSEYKMIQGFTLFHMSEESTLDDIFIGCRQPFDYSTSEKYGKTILEMMTAYIESWNRDSRLTAETGIIRWKASYDERQTDAVNFAVNMNKLAGCLSCDGEEKKLIVALLPQRLEDLKSYREWVADTVKAPVSSCVCYMLYDTYDARLFGDFEEKFPFSFKYIIPDADIFGAVNQVLEEKKQEAENEEDRAHIGFQQLLLKLSEASGQGNEKEALSYSRQALELIKDYDQPHMEALIYYFLHSMYVSLKKGENAEETIDKAIGSARAATDKEMEGGRMSCCQYLTVKGNMYFMDKKYEKAISCYSEALELSGRDCVLGVRIAIYQMLGTCKRMGGYYDSWDCFTEGWKLVETQEEQQIKNQASLRYYALEMLKTGNSEERCGYIKRFSELWGEDWEEELEGNKKEQKQRLSVVS